MMPGPVFDEGGTEFPKGQFGGGPGGGGGGGGGGGFTAFAGGVGNPFGGGTPFGQNLSTRKKVTLRGGSMLGERAPSDTVPAWLTPGEFVEPVESVMMFGPLLEAIRQEGLRMRAGGVVPRMDSGYADGGPVDPFDDAIGMSLGGWLGKHWWMAPLAAAAAPALAGIAAGWGAGMPALTSGLSAAKATVGPAMGAGTALAAADQPFAGPDPAAAYYAMRQRDQEAPGYAMGGPVNWLGKKPAAPQPAGFTTQTGGMTARPAQTYQPLQTTAGAPPAPAPQPQRPIWGAPTPDLQNPSTGPYGDLGRAIGQFGQQGFYDPQGSQMTEEAMRAKALQDAQAYATQAGLAADVSGMDPAQAAAYRMQARVNAGRGVGQAMTDYRARIAADRDAWARQLFGMNFEEASKQLGRFQDYRHASRLGGPR